ncbi:hypothetical protein [Vreelandella neptunia]|nr:hypothetical protein [Halomonas neptunia]
MIEKHYQFAIACLLATTLDRYCLGRSMERRVSDANHQEMLLSPS